MEAEVWRKYKIFDTHCHIGDYGDIRRVSTVDTIRNYVQTYGIERILLSRVSKNITQDNDAVAAVVKSMSGKLIPQAHIDPTAADAVKEIERCVSMGFKGLKLHPVIDAYNVFDIKLLESVLEAASKKHLPILIHTGTPPMTTPMHVAFLAQNFPQVTLICAHSGLADSTYEILSAAKMAENLYFDTALASTPPVLENLISEFGAKRLLWGSDIPYGNFLAEFFRVYSLEISEEQKRMIYYDNAARIYGTN